MRHVRALCVLSGCALGLVLPTTLNAATLPEGTYRLLNHPDGAEAAPLYGMRLDELFNATGGHDVFTFDFNAVGSDMRITVEDDRLRIFGVSWGGRDIGSSYANDQYLGFYSIDFEYLLGVDSVPGDDDRWVDAANHAKAGSIVAPNALGSIGLEDERGGNAFSFRLGDENNDNGHRGFQGFSGWGWMNHGGGEHVYSSDWLFAVGGEVPAPGAMTLGLAGLGLFASRKRRD